MAGDFNALARIDPMRRAVSAKSGKRGLTQPEKAAIIVRFLLAEGSPVPISQLPDHLQSALTQKMSQMRSVDRQTLAAVLEEFIGQLEEVGLSFPGGIEAALAVMDGHISANAASRLRRMIGSSSGGDPWARLTALPNDVLLPVLSEESIEVAAVMLSMLPVAKSAELLGKLPGDRARRVAYAVSQTGNIEPATVKRIGIALASQLDAIPPRAFDTDPVQRVGAILNISPSLTREDVLRGLDEVDTTFAQAVRKAIFTFVHIPKRLAGRDVPKLIRSVDQALLVAALGACAGKPDLEAASDFILANMSQRLAQGLREEINALGTVKEKLGEDAHNAVVTAIRDLEAAGEIALIQEDDETSL
jgi:flagellar motor switch protein FliG